jgi:hypothetical protein
MARRSPARLPASWLSIHIYGEGLPLYIRRSDSHNEEGSYNEQASSDAV